MFNLFSKKEELVKIEANDEDIVAILDGKVIDIKTVSDEMFKNEMMGKTIAFEAKDKKAKVCSPANGEIAMIFPTGHAFGIKTNTGVEILVHIGVDTVGSNGKGFKVLKNNNDKVNAGDPIVEVDFNLLSKTYEMPIMVIITNPNDIDFNFIEPTEVKRGQKVNK